MVDLSESNSWYGSEAHGENLYCDWRVDKQDFQTSKNNAMPVANNRPTNQVSGPPKIMH